MSAADSGHAWTDEDARQILNFEIDVRNPPPQVLLDLREGHERGQIHPAEIGIALDEMDRDPGERPWIDGQGYATLRAKLAESRRRDGLAHANRSGPDADDGGQLAEAGLSRVDVDKFLAEPVPEADWLWENVIERGELVWLAGAGKTGKSMIALFLGVALVRGRVTFLGEPLGRCGGVIYIDAENRERTIRRRLHWSGLQDSEGIEYLTARGTDLGNQAGRDALKYLAGDREPLIVLDSLIGLHRSDEDSAREVRDFALAMREVQDSSGATILGIAHENRAGNLRGSLDWRNNADRVLTLGKGEDGLRTLEVFNARDDEEGHKFRVRFERREGGPLTVERVTEGGQVEVPEVMTKGQALEDTILQVLREPPALDPQTGVAEPNTRANVARRVGKAGNDGTFGRAWTRALKRFEDEPAEFSHESSQHG